MKKIYYPALLFLLAILLSKGSFEQIAHVATVDKYIGSASTTITQAFSAASINHDLIVVHLSYDNKNRQVSTVSDNKGNHYTKINGPVTWNSTFRSELWYAFNITNTKTTLPISPATAPLSVTATLSGASTSFLQIYVSEFTGALTTDPLDKNNDDNGGSPTPSSKSVTTTAAGELIYGIAIGSNGILTHGTGFTAINSDNQNIVETKTGTTAGSYTATFNATGGSWVAVIATFKAAPVTLPIELTSFDATIMNKTSVQLDWATATEINNDYFEVQRSNDGANWTDLSRVNGTGNSTAVVHYSATDNSPLTGLSYYRLVQYDLDGKATYSKVVTVNFDASSTGMRIKLYPVPAVNYMTVEGDEADLQSIGVVNASGQWMTREIQVNRVAGSKITLNLSTLPQGVYFLKTKTSCAPFYKQ